jgi:hypothetical protein
MELLVKRIHRTNLLAVVLASAIAATTAQAQTASKLKMTTVIPS